MNGAAINRNALRKRGQDTLDVFAGGGACVSVQGVNRVHTSIQLLVTEMPKMKRLQRGQAANHSKFHKDEKVQWGVNLNTLTMSSWSCSLYAGSGLLVPVSIKEHSVQLRVSIFVETL